MSAPTLTLERIRRWCGRFAFEDGQALLAAGRVTVLDAYEDEEGGSFAGVGGGKGDDGMDGGIDELDGLGGVVGRHRRRDASVEDEEGVRRVRVWELGPGEAKAACGCPAFHPEDQYCKHIAAVLLALRDAGGGAPANDGGLASRVLELFDPAPVRSAARRSAFDARAPLAVEFLCEALPDRREGSRIRVGLRLGLSPATLVPVRRIDLLLDAVERGSGYAAAKGFAYDPESHRFQADDAAVVEALLRAARADPGGAASKRAPSPGALDVHPFAWRELLPLLRRAPLVKLTAGGVTADGIHGAEGPLPLSFAFDAAGAAGDVRLDVSGLEGIVALPEYDAVFFEGRLLEGPPDERRRLFEFIRLLETSRTKHIRIPRERFAPFMEKALPGLRRLGAVRLADDVADRLVREPLVAKLYLDRVRDRLVAGVEFHYGDIVVNPIEAGGRQGGEERVALRDDVRERRILELLERCPFVQTEAGLFLAGEDDEYEFLYRVVPELERWAKVYATTAVRNRLLPLRSRPKLKVEADERTDWLELRLDLEGVPESEIRSLVRSLREKRKYHRLSDGTLVPLEGDGFREISRFLSEAGAGDELRVPLLGGLHALERYADGDALGFGARLRRLLAALRNPDHAEHSLGDGFAGTLRDYQAYGFHWMMTLAKHRFGGILADEMGLGKTIQAIAYLVASLPAMRAEGTPALIVCPASLLYNWRNELCAFAPGLRVAVADDAAAARRTALANAPAVDAIVTSYPLLRRDLEIYRKLRFHTLILDEAQFIKNNATQTAQAAKAVDARHRFALTGTPVENAAEELWSICHVVCPGLFPGKKAFAELGKEAIVRRLRPFLLRRRKSDVLQELPEKIETVLSTALLPEQKKLYAAYLARLRDETEKQLAEDGFQKAQLKILAGITRLRQLCCHPALFVEGYTGASAKFEELLALVEDGRKAGRRMLVFSQFTEMLGLIRRELGRRGVPQFYLDGSTKPSERVSLVERFNAGERDVFLVSLKAGGTGLNLTGADTVILYDLWWNPAVERQAEDRAHRIGQKRVVQVVRLLSQGTVEEKMFELQQRKRRLAEELVAAGEPGWTEGDVRELLSLSSR
ncbi:DEAD/DEAH box helicase [Paenibacillus sp.]|uniref:DEAD/DEAH box helicase n=1 Tax=Paenibacillus sp. TaxID=58172 RepID=UPI002D475A5D|nr:DEAD/DEAH box helicase [Paenibacillus sp.]HZG57179.1 DEAD/DEAH box helicase [Paenibacillus sp.]